MTTIDNRLTEINIDELISQVGVPFNNISDTSIEECIKHKIFLAPHCIYNNNAFSYDTHTYHAFSYDTHTYHLLRIATIVNEIQTDKYNYNYPISIWDDSEDDAHHEWAIDCGEHHIRAFYYCKKNIYMSINRSG